MTAEKTKTNPKIAYSPVVILKSGEFINKFPIPGRSVHELPIKKNRKQKNETTNISLFLLILTDLQHVDNQPFK